MRKQQTHPVSLSKIPSGQNFFGDAARIVWKLLHFFPKVVKFTFYQKMTRHEKTPVNLRTDGSAADYWSRPRDDNDVDDNFNVRSTPVRTRLKSALGALAYLPTPFNVQDPPKFQRHHMAHILTTEEQEYIDGEVDARIYVRNIPIEYSEDFIRGIVTQYGSATVVDFLRSRLNNGRRSAFIHMNRHKSAMDAIRAINRTRLPNSSRDLGARRGPQDGSEEFLLAKLQKLHPVRPVEPWADKHIW